MSKEMEEIINKYYKRLFEYELKKRFEDLSIDNDLLEDNEEYGIKIEELKMILNKFED